MNPYISGELGRPRHREMLAGLGVPPAGSMLTMALPSGGPAQHRYTRPGRIREAGNEFR